MDIPPYGVLYKSLKSTAEGSPDSVLDPKRWTKTFVAVVGAINENLWPCWDYNKRDWSQSKTKSAMTSISMADLKCIKKLSSWLTKPVDGTSMPQPTHGDLFLLEDRGKMGADIMASQKHYLSCSFGDFKDAIADAKGMSGLREYIAKTKFIFQRPRPAQMSLLLREPIEVEYAESSLTPSLVSGHALQGIMVLTAAYMNMRTKLDATQESIIMKWAVGIGDRRVFAGVHYPSDNFASWFVASQIATSIWPKAGEANEAKAFLWNAIAKYSLVFQESAKHDEFIALRSWLQLAFTGKNS
jgi:hypothetical protein